MSADLPCPQLQLHRLEAMSQCGAISQPIVQIDSTRHCNLQCRHCYSSSGPKVHDALRPEDVIRFLVEARTQGYMVASFSGGEPMIYPYFFHCAEAAASLGFGVTVTTNAMLIDDACAERLATAVSLVAVSVDGPPDLHNSLRGSAAAFEGAVRGMSALHKAGVRFGIIHTITPKSIPHLRWLHEFARAHGAALLQLHPMEAAGRAIRASCDDIPDSRVATRASLLGMIFSAESDDRPPLQVDYFSREMIATEPRLVFADDGVDTREDASLSTLVNPLVLETNGDVVPLAYGFGRNYRVCNILHGNLTDALPSFRTEVYPRFRALCRKLWAEILARDDLPYFNWYDRVTQASLEPEVVSTS